MRIDLLPRLRETFLFVLISATVLAFTLLFIKEIYVIQVEDHKIYQNSIQSYRVETDTLYAVRGSILDRNSKPIAMTLNSYELGIHPEQVVGVVDELSGLLKNFVSKDHQEIYDLLVSDKKFVWIDRNLTPDAAEFLQNILKGYPGWEISRNFQRSNLIDQTSHFIGAVDIDGVGVEGIELIFNDDLKGVNGSRTYEAAQNGVRIPQGEINKIDPRHGKDLLLTIDSDLQFEASNQCKIAVEETGAERCSIVLMNADNGEIYALVEEGNSRILDMNLISVRGQYEPGSSLKIFTIGSVLESNKTNIDAVFSIPYKISKMENSCEDWYEGDKGCFKDFLPHDEEILSVKKIIERSSNVGAIKIVDMSNIKEVEEFLVKFGFSSKTGIEVPGEIKGNIQPNKTCSTCLASLAIGYSINVTQLQMVKAYAIIANGGLDVIPTLIKNTVIEGNVEKRVVTSELAEELKMLLINVVNGEDGTARIIRKDGLVLGGKTGTSKSYIEDQKYSEKKYNTSFTGFFETENSLIVGSVILWHAKTSQHSEYVTGASTAAPIFGNLVDSIVKSNILERK